MRGDTLLAVISIVLGAVGTYLMLPHRHGAAKPKSVHAAGLAMVVLAVLMLAYFWTAPGLLLGNVFFYGFALAAILGGVLMVTSRNPVHRALWFASVVLSTSGLFLLAGAQFLAAGTVIVYAGAIIVTFLFVIMLAQAEGQALYDRSARGPAWSTLSCFLLLWTLIYALVMVQRPDGPPLTTAQKANRLVRTDDLSRHPGIAPDARVNVVLERAIRPTTSRLLLPSDDDAAPPPHVAGLGGTLFTDHLVSVEVAGALLFIALVGAAAIATPKMPVRPGESNPEATQAG